MSVNIVTVADGPRISLSAALNIIVAQKTCPAANFHIAIPEDSAPGAAITDEVFRKYATSIYEIPTPQMHVENKLYRIENKINSLRCAPVHSEGVIFMDSDTIILRPLPIEYLFSSTPRAVPEHGLHLFPWGKLFPMLGLEVPTIKTLLAGGEVGPPWLNAGFVVCPNAEAFGAVWHMMANFVMRLDWVPERWPYLDQIALPLAIAQFTPTRSVTHDNILPAQFNQNLFYWADDQSATVAGYVVHHHARVALLEKYLPRLLMWVRDDYPIIKEILDALREFDRRGE